MVTMVVSEIKVNNNVGAVIKALEMTWEHPWDMAISCVEGK